MNNLLGLKKKTRVQQAVNLAAAQKKRIEKGRWDGAILFEIKQPDNYEGQPHDSREALKNSYKG